MSTGFTFGAKPNTPAFGQANLGTQQPTGSITFGTPVATNITTPAFASNTQSSNLFGTPAKTTNFTFGTASSGLNTGGLAFGTSTPSSGLTFGAPNVSVPPAGLPFAAPSTNTGLGFGSAQPTGTGFTFGTPAIPAPNTGLTNTGLMYGAAQSSIPSTGLSFGATTSAPTGLTFGAVTTSAPGLAFGSTPVSTGLSFGTATTSTGLSFGSAPNTGLTFGSAVPPTVNTGLSFGTPALSANTGASPFGMTTPVVSTGLSFGTPANTTGLSFATPATSASTGLSFGTSGGGLMLGGATTTAPSFGLSFGSTTAGAAPSFSFGTQARTTTASLNFGTPTTQTSALSFGLGGTSTGLNLTSKPTATTTTTVAVGLGGIASSTPATTATSGKTEVLPRDQPLPNEFLHSIENFKNFVKQQKNYSSDVARCSVKEFKKVAADVDLVNNLLNEVEKQLQTNRAIAEKLKYDTAKGLQHVEMAQRTFDTPPGLQYENTAPINFFKELVDKFEREMQNLKLQIENTDKYVKNLGKPSSLNSQDLATGMRRLHETFVALAGRLQSVHSQVETQKEHYLNLRKYMLNDDGNVFEKPTKQDDALKIALNSINYKPPTIASGPTPFNSLSHPSVVQAAVQHQTQSQPGVSNLGTQTSSLFGTQSTGQSLFGSSTLGSSFGQPSLQFNSPSTNFQLQKPPLGNKRGKQ